MHSFAHRTFLLCGLLFSLSLLPCSGDGRTIDWGNAVMDVLVDSHGNALDSTYTIELGTFGSFTPTGLNQGDWMANWKVFDRAIAGTDWIPSMRYFNSSASVMPGGVSSEAPPLPSFTFAQGEQAYMFVYNSLAFDYVSEWALITNSSLDGTLVDDWLMPAPGSKEDSTIEWRVSNASVVIHGGLNDEQSYGVYTVDPGTFALQTHVVPEPAGMVLVMLGIAFSWFPRRRNTRRG
ncbi:MAG TPA: PEP-CTERM sorting domain-containing protein [Prosthecobacter sp.]